MFKKKGLPRLEEELLELEKDQPIESFIFSVFVSG